jgi:hypothetical protein
MTNLYAAPRQNPRDEDEEALEREASQALPPFDRAAWVAVMAARYPGVDFG